MTCQSEEIESLAQWDAHAHTLAGWFVQSVDLSEREADLARVDPVGAIFLGCALADEQVSGLRLRGALVFPRLPDVPFNPYRPSLYNADELLGPAGTDHADTVDARVYAWTRCAGTRLAATLASTLHDHAITDALDGPPPTSRRATSSASWAGTPCDAVTTTFSRPPAWGPT